METAVDNRFTISWYSAIERTKSKPPSRATRARRPHAIVKPQDARGRLAAECDIRLQTSVNEAHRGRKLVKR